MRRLRATGNGSVRNGVFGVEFRKPPMSGCRVDSCRNPDRCRRFFLAPGASPGSTADLAGPVCC